MVCRECGSLIRFSHSIRCFIYLGMGIIEIYTLIERDIITRISALTYEVVQKRNRYDPN